MKFCRKRLSFPAETVSRIDVVFEELYCFYKRRVCSDHDHVYGIEMVFAIETSGEVGIQVDGGMESSAQWASKSKQIVSDSCFDVQQGYDCVDGDVVSEHSEEIRRISFCHDRASYGS
jgi:hypothetical protein